MIESDMIRKLYILTLLIVLYISLSIQKADYLFKTFPGLRVRHALYSLTVSPGEATRCTLMCVDNKDCYGVNFHKNDGICEINVLRADGHCDIIDNNSPWTTYLRFNRK
jgi:hypothetical protein